MIALLLSRWKLIVSVLVVLCVLGSALYIYRAGEHSADQEHEIERLIEYKVIREKIDEVPRSPTRDAAVERLRGNGLVRD